MTHRVALLIIFTFILAPASTARAQAISVAPEGLPEPPMAASSESPVVGPFVQLGFVPNSEADGWVAPLLMTGFLQVFSLAALITALVIQRPPTPSSESRSAAASILVSPAVTSRDAGVVVHGRF